MSKPILILGPGRTGKTTLARLLRAELPTYNLLHADALRAAIMKQLPLDTRKNYCIMKRIPTMPIYYLVSSTSSCNKIRTRKTSS